MTEVASLEEKRAYSRAAANKHYHLHREEICARRKSARATNRARADAALTPEKRAHRARMRKIAAIRAAVMRRRADATDGAELHVAGRGVAGWIDSVLEGLDE